MWWKIAAEFPVVRLQAALTGYRVHSGNISRNYPTMITGQQQLLEIAFATIRPLQTNWRLRCLARSYMFCEIGWEQHCLGQHWSAIMTYIYSFLIYPCAHYTEEGAKIRWGRVIVCCRIALAWITDLVSHLLRPFRKRR